MSMCRTMQDLDAQGCTFVYPIISMWALLPQRNLISCNFDHQTPFQPKNYNRLHQTKRCIEYSPHTAENQRPSPARPSADGMEHDTVVSATVFSPSAGGSNDPDLGQICSPPLNPRRNWNVWPAGIPQPPTTYDVAKLTKSGPIHCN